MLVVTKHARSMVDCAARSSGLLRPRGRRGMATYFRVPIIHFTLYDAVHAALLPLRILTYRRTRYVASVCTRPSPHARGVAAYTLLRCRFLPLLTQPALTTPTAVPPGQTLVLSEGNQYVALMRKQVRDREARSTATTPRFVLFSSVATLGGGSATGLAAYVEQVSM